MTNTVSSRTTALSYVSSFPCPCYRLFYQVTMQLLYRNMYINTYNHRVYGMENKSRPHRRRASQPIDTLSAYAWTHFVSDNIIVSIKNKRVLRRFSFLLRRALSFEGRLSPINIRSPSSRRRVDWVDQILAHTHIWRSCYFIILSAFTIWSYNLSLCNPLAKIFRLSPLFEYL